MIGQLRHRITIQTATVDNGATGRTQTWTDTETRWARVIRVKAEGKAKYAQAGFGEVDYEVIFKGDVDYTMKNNRLKWGSKYLELIEPARNHEQLGKYTKYFAKDNLK
jgi:head-tail adaptor